MVPCAVGNRHQPLSFVEHCLDLTSDSHFQPIFSPILLNSLSTYVKLDRLRLGLTLNVSITGRPVVIVHIFACPLTLLCLSFVTEILNITENTAIQAARRAIGPAAIHRYVHRILCVWQQVKHILLGTRFQHG